MHSRPFMIQGPTLTEILRRDRRRCIRERIARMLGFSSKTTKIHVARIGREEIESNLPLP